MIVCFGLEGAPLLLCIRDWYLCVSVCVCVTMFVLPCMCLLVFLFQCTCLLLMCVVGKSETEREPDSYLQENKGWIKQETKEEKWHIPWDHSPSLSFSPSLPLCLSLLRFVLYIESLPPSLPFSLSLAPSLLYIESLPRSLPKSVQDYRSNPGVCRWGVQGNNRACWPAFILHNTTAYSGAMSELGNIGFSPSIQVDTPLLLSQHMNELEADSPRGETVSRQQVCVANGTLFPM